MRFSKFLSISAAALVCLLSLCTVACSSSNLVPLLDATVSAADAAVAELASSGTIDPAAAQKITNYLGQVATAASEASTELASSDSTAVKTEKITADFAAIVVPDVANLSPALAASIRAVDAAVQAFVSALTSANAQIEAHGVQNAQIGVRDRLRLEAIKRHAESVISKLARL